jgi:hypothetical protein
MRRFCALADATRGTCALLPETDGARVTWKAHNQRKWWGAPSQLVTPRALALDYKKPALGA